jgi:hypothetical protein
MRLLLLLITTMLASPAAMALEPVGTVHELSEKERVLYKRMADNVGLNCPIPGPITFEAEDGRGRIFRLRCNSVSAGAAGWDLRLTETYSNVLVERW